MKSVKVSWGGGIPVSSIDGIREALQALFGNTPRFEAEDAAAGVWLVELPAEYAAFGTLIMQGGPFTLTGNIVGDNSWVI
ncbi:hypothetical protein [Nonomuraea sp. NPDC046570]|uniref:hypothetical protein n=1 Tax=Nonomuraea sp. NPDC046570 TaxID=3155255 RepID=UPI0034060BF7